MSWKGSLMSYAALIRPVVDRVYLSVRVAARPALREAYARFGVGRGFESSFYFGLLARPLSAAAFAAATTYSGSDMTVEVEQGTAWRDEAGDWHLTERGRQVAAAVQRVLGETAERLWSHRPIPTMPGLAGLDRLNDLTAILLEAGRSSGGPAFLGLTPVFEPEDASAATRLTTRLGALRHHRGDAHRAAWRAEGLTVEQVEALEDGPVRERIEAETNRLDAPIYTALTDDQRWALLAGLGALPDRFA